MLTFEQPDLVFNPPLKPEEDNSISARFARFHAANPAVYDALVTLSREALRRNRSRKIGIGMIFEVLRWNYYLTTDDEDGYKLNNTFCSCYSRLIMEQEPDLSGCFNVRKSVVDEK